MGHVTARGSHALRVGWRMRAHARGLTTVLGVLESSRRYEHTSAIKRQFGTNFDKTRDSTMTSLTRFEAVVGLEGVETVFVCDWIW